MSSPTLREPSARSDSRPSSNRSSNGSFPRKPKADDFLFGKEIGEGSFSTVYLAKDVTTKREYAIKVLQKDKMQREHKVEYVMRERNILNKIGQQRHPFFVKLYATFQDATRLYFVLSYEPNGELLDYIRKLSAFDMESTRFYTSEIVLALEYLHGLNIVHRDLKPENILLSREMHIRITDFGSAKELGASPGGEAGGEAAPPRLSPSAAEPRPSRNKRRGSFVGTAQYVSPEMLQNKPITKGCDLWALGCILYQLISGEHPFRGPSEYLIFNKILKMDYEFPDGFNEDGKDLVQKLLMSDSEERLGSDKTGSYKALKAHPFFTDVDWEGLPTSQAPKLVPYLPPLSDHNSEAIWSNIEQAGLDGKQLGRLEGLLLSDGDGASNPSDLEDREDESEQIETEYPELLLPAEEKAGLLAKQASENVYHKFVENNLILHQGLLDKRKGLFARRRMFLMTEGPHLYYVDPVHMVLKGEIPWSRTVRPEHKNFKVFFVHTPKRTYYLEDPSSYALVWCRKIQELWKYYYGPRNPKYRQQK